LTNPPIEQGVRVPAGGDRFGRRRKIFGSMSIDYKVPSSDTDGGLFVVENTNDSKGGPPRHLHHEQEEWFYVVEGEYLAEIGEEHYRLGPGDSVFAPREIPHIWAHVGERTGRLIVAFRPAGEMEDFFDAMSQLEGAASGEELQQLFRSHGMEVTGPPLEVE
jgi:quercetin dioxygenase-like cupin family protein